MAYINKEEVAAIRKQLKKSFPKSKFSVRKCSSSLSVDVSVLKHDVDFSDKFSMINGTYIQVYHNYIDSRRYNKEQIEFLLKIKEIILTAPSTVTGEPFHDNTDIMTDYFDVSYYYNITIGAWNKPYVFIK